MFNLTAQLLLQAPANLQRVVGQIRSQIQNITANINIAANTRQLAQIVSNLTSINRGAVNASRSVSELGNILGAAARRFGAISIATGTFLGLTRSIRKSIGDAIEFERQMVILAQTTGKSVRELNGLYKEVDRLSTSLGVSSDGLVKTAIVLAQAGMEAKKTKAALEVLAKTQLAASFDNIVDTTEGAIALLSQFRSEAIQAGGDIKFLEKSLEAINEISKKFAVESSDLIAVIRRSGGAFEAAGGSLNELLALFTSVRATTRESAETISTGLRTIFTRIQRTDTIKALQDLGITLQDVEGKFVGPYEAIKRISEGLSSLDPRDFRFAAIVEELGGFRQIGKVIPLIKQFTVAQDALNTAQQSSGSLSKDVETAQQSLANQIAKVREEFQSLVRKFSDSSSFRSIATGALGFAKALIKVVDALEPLLPMITALAAVQIGRGLVPVVGALAGVGRRRNQGGPIHRFATGGLVPGSGNRDTVPAMMTPGEFVIKKSSVKKIGADRLAHMNRGGTVQKFAYGGKAAKKNLEYSFVRPYSQEFADENQPQDPLRKAVSGKKSLDAKQAKNYYSKMSSDKNLPPLARAYLKRVSLQSGHESASFGSFKPDPAAEMMTGSSGTAFPQISFKGDKVLPNILKHEAGHATDFALAFAKKYKRAKFTSEQELDQAIKTFSSQKEVVRGNTQPMSATVGSFASFASTLLSKRLGSFAKEKGYNLSNKQYSANLDYRKKNEETYADLISKVPKDLRGLFATNVSLKAGSKKLLEYMKKNPGPIPGFADISPKDIEKALPDFRQNAASTLKARRKYKESEFAMGGMIQHFKKGSVVQKALKAKDIAASKREYYQNNTDISKTGVGSLMLAKPDDTAEHVYGAAFLTSKGQTPSVMRGQIDNIKGVLQKNPVYTKLQQIAKKTNNTILQDKLKDFKGYTEKHSGQFLLKSGALKQPIADKIETIIYKNVVRAMEQGAMELSNSTRMSRFSPANIGKLLKGVNIDNIIGNIYEGMLTNAGAPYKRASKDSPNAPFDYPKGLGSVANNFDTQALSNITTDAKTRYTASNLRTLIKKIKNYEGIKFVDHMNKSLAPTATQQGVQVYNKSLEGKTISSNDLKDELGVPRSTSLEKLEKIARNAGFTFTRNQLDKSKGSTWTIKNVLAGAGRMATGGNVAGSDTVPAMLTPGEFVVNKKSAQRIGYGALNRMNKTGVAGFAKGGPVGGVFRFQDGTPQKGVPLPRISGSALEKYDRIALKTLMDQFTQLTQNITLAKKIYATFAENLLYGSKATDAVNKALKVHETELKANNVVIKNLTDTQVNKKAQDKKDQQIRSTTVGKVNESNAITGKAKDCVTLCEHPLSVRIVGGNAPGGAPGNAPGSTPGSQQQGGQRSRLDSIRAVAQTAQQFVFLASTVSAVGVQYLGLAEAQSKAITETVAFGAIVIGAAGTIIDFAASLAPVGQAIFRGLAPVGAGIARALTPALGGLGTAFTGLGTAVGGTIAGILSFTAVVLGIVAVLGGLAALYVYYQQAYAKAETERIRKVNDQLADDIKSGKASISARQQYIGQEVKAAKTLVDSYIFVSNEQKSAIVDSAKRTAAAYIDGIIAIKKFEDKLQKIELDKSLTPFQQAAQSLQALSTSSDDVRQNLLRLSAERADLAKRAKGDKNFLTEDSFTDINDKNTFKKLTEQIGNDLEFLQKGVQAATVKFQAQLDESFKNTDFSKTITKDINADGLVNSLDLVMSQNNGLADSMAIVKNTILQNAQVEASRTKNTKQAAEILYKANMAVYDFEVSTQKQAEISRKAALSGMLLNKALQDSKSSLMVFKNVNNFLAKQVLESQKFSNLLEQNNNIISSQLGNFEIPEIKGLSDLKDIKDLQEFKTQVGNVASMFGQKGKEIEKVITATAESFQIVQQNLVNVPDLSKILSPTGAPNEILPNAIKMALQPLDSLPPAFQAFSTGIKNNLRSAVETSSPGQGMITEEEAKNAFEPLLNAIKVYNDVIAKITETASSHLKVYVQQLNALQGAYEKEIEFRTKAVDILSRGQQRMAEALNIDLSARQKDTARQQKRQVALTATGSKLKANDIAGIGKALGSAEQQRSRNAEKIEKLKLAPSEENIKKLKLLADEESKLALKTKQYRNILEDLSDQSEKASDVLGDIGKEKAKRELGTKILEDFVTGGMTEQTDIMKNFAGVQIAAQTGTLQNFDTETKKSVMGLLSQLGSVDKGFEQFRKQLIYSDAIMAGIDPQIAQMLATATPKEEQLLQELKTINAQEMQASEALRSANLSNITELQKNTQTMGQLITELAKNTQAQMNAAQKQIAQQEVQRQQQVARNQAQDAARAQTLQNQQNAENAARQQASQHFANITGHQPARKNKGGIIYASKGKSIFEPKGTDTVPAMLTPGEFVVQKSAVDQYGQDFMKMINSGKYEQLAADYGTLTSPEDPEISLHGSKGGPVYLAVGGTLKQKKPQARGAQLKQQRLQERQQKYAQAQQQMAYRRLPRAEKLKMQAAQQQQQKMQQDAAYRDYQMQNQAQYQQAYQQQQIASQKGFEAYQTERQQFFGGAQQAQQMEMTRRQQEAQQAAIKKQQEQAQYQRELPFLTQKQEWAKKTDPRFIMQKGENVYGTLLRVNREDINQRNKRSKEISTLATQNRYGTNSMFNAPTWMSQIMQNPRSWTRNAVMAQQGIHMQRPAGYQVGLGEFGGFASGGLIYASNGASIFKPKGTDTVPAMLTPGEFVMQKSAVDQYGAGFMNSVNNGQALGYNTGGIVYRQDGGIMDKLAGVAGGAMKAIGIDPNAVQNLTGSLTQTFDKFVGMVPSAFAPMIDGLNNFINAMTNFTGLSLDMNVNVDGALNIAGINTDQVVNAIKDGIGNMVANEVKKQLPNGNDFKTA